MPPVKAYQIPDWANPANASVLDNWWTRTARTIGQFMGMTDPASQVMGLAVAPIEVPAADAAGAVKQTLRAYHGSPHDFERFDSSKIGTGEGAQAYGHGLYFAESEGTGRNYMASLARTPEVAVNGESIELPKSAFDSQSARQTVANRLALQKKALRQLGWEDSEATKQAITQTEANINSALDSAVARGDESIRQSLARQKAELGLMKEQGINIGPTGRLYEVNIHASPDELLDWDKPLSQQPQKVREAFQRAGGAADPKVLEDRINSLQSQMDALAEDRLPTNQMREERKWMRLANERDALWDQWNNAQSGQKFYHSLGKPDQAAAVLKDAGIKGIQYLDQGSRAAGEGTRNFVIFDDKIIDIARKYGLSLPAAAQVYQAQQRLKPQQKGVE